MVTYFKNFSGSCIFSHGADVQSGILWFLVHNKNVNSYIFHTERFCYKVSFFFAHFISSIFEK